MKVRRMAASTVLLLGLAGCGTVEKKEDDHPEKTGGTEQTERPIEVDKSLLSVEIIIPPSFLNGEDPDDIITKMKEKDIKVTKNADGSLTYKMSKSTHKKLLEEMVEEMSKSLKEFEEDRQFPSIKKIDHEAKFSQFTITADREAFENSLDSIAVLSVGFGGLYYQLFEGVSPEKNKVHIKMKDEKTGVIFSEVTYPDDLSDGTDVE